MTNSSISSGAVAAVLMTAVLLAPQSAAMAQSSAGLVLPEGYYQTPRQKLNLDIGWRFHLGAVPGEPQAVTYDDSGWEEVSVPHTFRLTSLFLDGSTDDQYQKTFQRYIGWYRRHFTLNAGANEKVYLEFEGAHQVTEAWVNGRYVGKHAISAYTPFHFDITEYVRVGGQDNVVALKLDNTRNKDIPPDGARADYVLFSGLYRDVYLVVKNRLHVTFPWEGREAGVFVTTPSVSEDNATISVRTTVRNSHDSPRECTLLTRIVDANGRVIRKLKKTATIPPETDFTFSQVDGISEDLHLWSIDDPYLYRVHSTVFDGEDPVDWTENPLGIRWFELRDDLGLVMNGKPIELIGVNRHQQYPYVGDAVPNSLHWKDAVQFKKAGINTVRLAHYPHDNSFIEACDRLGILVTEEPPTWIEAGNETWMDNLEKSLRVMIRNHRNHPSIVIWGAGINHRGSIRRLHYAAKEEDPTRWTMSNSTVWTGLQESGVTDIFSTMDYREVPVTDRFLFAMEHRGSRDGERNQLLISRYKGSAARIGLTVWSGHDSNTLHRNGGPTHLARWGVLDSFRIPKPVYHWYQSEMTSAPMIRIADDWNDADIKRVRVFSNCDEVELFLNGYSLGRRGPDADPSKKNLTRPPFTFPVVWQAGELTAKGFIGGDVKAVHSVRTPEEPDHLTLTVDTDQRSFTAGGGDIVMAYATVRDRHGQVMTSTNRQVTFRVEGPGKIVGDSSIGANPKKTERGVAAVMLRSGAAPGLITLTASTEGIGDARAKVASVPFKKDVLLAGARPIYELLLLQVDIGQAGAHIEDGWTGWIGVTSADSTYRFDGPAGLQVTVGPLTDSGRVEWSDTADVAGPLGRVAEDGLFTLAESGLHLTFSGLPAGEYSLKTYHHEASREIDGYRQDRPGPQASPKILVTVDDAEGSGRLITDALGHSVGKAIGNSKTPSHVSFRLHSNGRDTMTVRFKGEQGRLWLNGFELREEL